MYLGNISSFAKLNTTSKTTADDIKKSYDTKYNIIKNAIESNMIDVCIKLDNNSLNKLDNWHMLRNATKYTIVELCDKCISTSLNDKHFESFVHQFIIKEKELITQLIIQAFKINDEKLAKRGFESSTNVCDIDTFYRKIAVKQ